MTRTKNNRRIKRGGDMYDLVKGLTPTLEGKKTDQPALSNGSEIMNKPTDDITNSPSLTAKPEELVKSEEVATPEPTSQKEKSYKNLWGLLGGKSKKRRKRKENKTKKAKK